jgi:LysM repeat protein
MDEAKGSSDSAPQNQARVFAIARSNWLVVLGVLLFAGLVPFVFTGASPSGQRTGSAQPAFEPLPVGTDAAVEEPALATPTMMPEPGLTATPTLGGTAVPKVRLHVVEAGETVALIAGQYGLSPHTIVAVNDLVDPNVLRIGEELVIPPTEGLPHTVRTGETVRGIADAYGVELDAIVRANDLADPDRVSIDTRLFVPGGRLPVESASARDTAVSTPPGEQAGAADQEQGSAAAGPSASAVSIGPQRVSATAPPPVTASYIAILDGATGELLWGADEHARVPPASITKIVTTRVALEHTTDLSQVVPVTVSGSTMAARDGSSIMGLEPGQRVSLRTLLFGMMLPSGNDAAEQVAGVLAGSRQEYVAWMNQKVAALGLRDTHFVNPSGMDAAGHYTSAYDIAVLARDAMQDARFRELAGAGTYHGDGFSMRNLNRLIGAYPGADGVKIGSTTRAGKTMVASATRNGNQVYVSLLHSRDLPGDGTALLNWVWQSFRW